MKKKVIKSAKMDEDLSLESKLGLKDSAHYDLSAPQKIIHSQSQPSRGQAEEVFRKATEEADKIKKRAKQIYLDVEKRVKEAEQRGFADGREQGLQALTEMALTMQKKNQEIIKQLEKQALELVYEMGRKIIGECFQTSDEALLSMLRQALQSSMGNQLVLLVNPKDFQRIQSEQTSLVQALHGSQTLILKPAETVKLHGCIVESEMGTLEANLESQLAAIKKALGVS